LPIPFDPRNDIERFGDFEFAHSLRFAALSSRSTEIAHELSIGFLFVRRKKRLFILKRDTISINPQGKSGLSGR
jgi:hypothetical protein